MYIYFYFTTFVFNSIVCTNLRYELKGSDLDRLKQIPRSTERKGNKIYYRLHEKF